MNNITLRKIISVSILLLGIYYLLSVVPKNKVDDRDKLIITLVLFVVYLLYDNLFTNNKENLDPDMGSEMPPVPPMPPVPSMPSMPSMPPAPSMPPTPPMNIQMVEDIPKIDECTTCKVDLSDHENVKKIANEHDNLAHSFTPTRRYPSVGSRMENGIMTNEMPYTDYNTLPIGAGIDSKVDDFSYTFLPPDRWYPIPPHPPVCIAEKQCPVCPISSSSEVATLKEWGEASRVTPGDQVNTTYLEEKLNSGR
jgi:hypothetical protein